jgi:class III poly(R)-hydroxyalkanoic acid synthase PhaE subunit
MQGNAGQFKNPLTDAMEHWWQSVAPSMPEGSAEFMNKILEQGKIYYFLGEQFNKIINETSKLGNTGRGWERILNKQFEEMKTAFGKMQNDANETAHKMAGAWQLMPMDTLRRTFALSSVMPGDFLGAMKHDEIRQMTDKFLSIQGVGYTRESQEQFQEGIRLWNEYQKVSQEYNQAWYKVGMEAIEAMRQKILAMAKEGKAVKSLRELYDLWIDCNEEAYASFAHTPEYSRIYGRLTNALMAVKQHGRNIVDEGLGALNVPTHKGINTLQKRQYDMGRQQKDALKKIQDLQQEIAELHNLFKPVRASDTSESSVPAVKRRTTKAPVIASNKKRKERAKTSISRKKKKKHAKKDKMIVIKI